MVADTDSWGLVAEKVAELDLERDGRRFVLDRSGRNSDPAYLELGRGGWRTVRDPDRGRLALER